MRKSFTYIFRGDVIYILLAQIGKHMKLKNTLCLYLTQIFQPPYVKLQRVAEKS